MSPVIPAEPPPEQHSAGAWKVPLKGYRLGMVIPFEHRRRVRMATKGIQKVLIQQGYLKADMSHLDGGWGSKTDLALMNFQRDHDLTIDGIVYLKTAKALWANIYLWCQTERRIPGNLLYGQGYLESALDPGAEGDNPRGPDWYDRGIHQINRHYHPDVADEQAYDPSFSIAWSANRLRESFDSLGGWRYAVAAHNNPAEAKLWSKGGTPSDQLLSYVELVYAAASK